MASDLISREALLRDARKLMDYDEVDCKMYTFRINAVEVAAIKAAPAVDAIPIDTVAEMLAELFGEECCCNYNGIDEWLPMLCEHSDTCPDAIGKNGCWKQFIKHWKERKKDAVD